MPFIYPDGSPVKSKEPKKITKAQKRELREIARQPAMTAEQRVMAMFGNSASPSDREAARAMMEKS